MPEEFNQTYSRAIERWIKWTAEVDDFGKWQNSKTAREEEIHGIFTNSRDLIGCVEVGVDTHFLSHGSAPVVYLGNCIDPVMVC